MRLENYSVAAFEALEPDDTLLDTAPPVAPAEPLPPPAAEPASTRLSDMARQPPLDMPLPVELPVDLPRARLPRIVDGDGPRRSPSREGFERESFQSFDAPADGSGLAGEASMPAEMPAAEAPVAAAPVAAPAPVATPAAIAPAPDAVPPVALSLPQGDVVNPAWLAARETAVQALHTDIEAARAAARSAPPADVTAAPGTGWVAAPTDGDGNPVAGSVFVPDAAAAAAAPAVLPAWMLRDGAAPAPQGQWLSFDDGAFEQACRARLAAQPEASEPLSRLAQLYGVPTAGLLDARPEVWTLATLPHALNAGTPPVPGLAMGDPATLGQLDLYLADPFITQLRTQLGGTPAAPTSTVALEQQRLYGTQRYAELTQFSQALAAVRQTHAAAMQAARDGGGPGWVEMPLQFGTDPETGWPTGQYVTVGDGEILRDANGMPVIATQRVFDEARFTNAWLAEGAQNGGLAQQAFASFYGQAQSHLSLQQDSSENAGPPRWVSEPGLDNPHVALGDSGVWDGDAIALDLNHTPRLNNGEAVGFDPQLGWVTSRDNLYEHRGWFERAMPVVMVAFVGWATAGAGLAAGWGAVGSAAAAGAAASFAGGVINGNLSLKGVLIGAVSGALTAGLTPQLTGVLKDAGLGAAAGVAARMTVQGGIQALLGGKFTDGAIAGFASGLAELTGAHIKATIDEAVKAGTMSATEAFAARTFNTVLGSALRAAASPGDPAQAFAQEWLGSLMQDHLPQPATPAPAPTTDGDGVQTFPVPAPAPADVVPLPGAGAASPFDLLSGINLPTGLTASPRALDEFAQRVQDGIQYAATQADLDPATYAAQRYEALLGEEPQSLAAWDPDDPVLVAGPGGVRGGPPAAGSGLRLSVNQRAQTVFEALSNAPASDAFGLIPEAYRDIKFIAPLLQEQRLLNEAERMRTLLGQSGYDVTPEKLGVTRSIYGDGSVRYDAVDMVNRYADAVRLLELRRQGVIELDTRDFSVKSVGTARVPVQEFVRTVKERYTEAFKAGYEAAVARLDAGKSLGYPADMPRQLQLGLAADDVAKKGVSQYLFSIGSPEGPGQAVALNRWAYDQTGATNRYIRPDVLIDLGVRQREWIDGKSTYINNGVLPQQLFDFFQFTGSQSGYVVTGSGGVFKLNPPKGGKRGP